tara:strand:- start:932 stop:1960 length:1029 start_codon:yes stop_codon:yes gene_type:complete
MLREVKNKHPKPRISPFQLTTTSGGVTVNQGYGDYTATRTAAGTGVLTARQGFSRNGLFFATSGLTVGSYAYYNAATNVAAAFTYKLVDEAGTAAEGSIDGFTFGWDNTDLSLCKQQRVSATQTSPRIIWGKVTGTTGAVAINAKDFSCTRTVAGTYTVTFTKAFGKTPVVMATGSGNSSTTVANNPIVTGKTAAGCTITIGDESPAAADGDFYILVIGSDSRSDSARGRMPLQNSQRKPRIVAGQVTMASGTPTISIGGATGGADLITIVDIGAGNFSVVIAESFIREPAIFLSSTTQRAEVKSYTAGVIDIKTKAANGNDTDVDGVTNIFIIGTDVNETF